MIYRSTAVRGARIYRKASKKGSFVDTFVILISDPFVQGVAVGTFQNAFYDFVKFTFNSAMGKIRDPETKRVREIAERQEPIIGQLTESLEEPLKEMHRPIGGDNNVTINVERPRSPLVRMDVRTYNYLHEDVITDLEDGVVGNVTKYNTLSGYGRVFLDRYNRTYSFKIEDYLGVAERHLLTWSLDDSYRVRGGGKLNLTIRSVETMDGNVKRVIVYGVSRLPRHA